MSRAHIPRGRSVISVDGEQGVRLTIRVGNPGRRNADAQGTECFPFDGLSQTTCLPGSRHLEAVHEGERNGNSLHKN